MVVVLISQCHSRLEYVLQQYVPVTFSMSMFVVGGDYEEADVKAIVDRLLAVKPARRQPEAH